MVKHLIVLIFYIIVNLITADGIAQENKVKPYYGVSFVGDVEDYLKVYNSKRFVIDDKSIHKAYFIMLNIEAGLHIKKNKFGLFLSGGFNPFYPISHDLHFFLYKPERDEILLYRTKNYGFIYSRELSSLNILNEIVLNIGVKGMVGKYIFKGKGDRKTDYYSEISSIRYSYIGFEPGIYFELQDIDRTQKIGYQIAIEPVYHRYSGSLRGKGFKLTVLLKF